VFGSLPYKSILSKVQFLIQESRQEIFPDSD